MPVSLTTTDGFWTALDQSGLLKPRRLAMARAIAAEDPEATAAEIAQKLVVRGMLTRFQADRLLEGRSRGFRFDRYKIVDVLGLGGMGWVYRAVDVDTGDQVALKVLRDDLKHDAGMLARFHQEAAVGLKLNHPHIMRTRSLGEAGGLPYMILDFVAGPNLLEVLLKRQRLPWQQACEVVRQAALGLEFAHAAGVVHRDVKPQNLIIDSKGHVRLLDFGLSMLRDGEHGHEFSLAMIFGHEGVGTMEYAAPEQATDSLVADARSDLFSLGGTLFAALTGLNPLQPVLGKPGVYRREKQVHKFFPEIPQAVADIVTRLMAENPADRFASAKEVAEALAPWSKPLEISFDYADLVCARKRDAELRLARLSKEGSKAQRVSQSTARPHAHSSVAQTPVGRRVLSADRDSELAGAIPFANTLADALGGAAAEWSREQTASKSSLMARLILEDGSQLVLQPMTTRIGRGGDCDLQIPDHVISQQHCELQPRGNGWWIRDLESRNGTFVNGTSIRRCRLKAGDTLVIGQLRLRFEPPPPAAVKSCPSPWVRWSLLAVIALTSAATGIWLFL